MAARARSRAKSRPVRPGKEVVAREVVWPIVLALVVLALAHRLLFLWSGEDRSWPFSTFYFGDTRVFFEHALDLLRGVVHEEGIPFRPPLFPRILAAVYALVGADAARAVVPHTAVRVVFSMVAALGPGLLYVLVRPYLGRVAAIAFALPWVWHFGALVVAVAPVVEGTYLTVLLGVLILWTRRVPSVLAADREDLATRARVGSAAVAVGVGIAVLHLLRAEAAVLGVAILLATLLPHRSFSLRQRLAWTGAIALGWALTLVPATVSHWRQLAQANATLALAEPLPQLVPVSLYGPLNFALANAPDADGRFSVAPLSRLGSLGKIDLEDPRQLAMVLHGDEEVWSRWRENPTHALRLVVSKWGWAAQAATLGWTGRNWPGGLVGERQPVDIFVPDRSIGAWIWLPLAAFGGITAWRRGSGSRRALGVLALSMVAPIVAITLFYGYARQALLALPFLLGLAGYGLYELARLGRLRYQGGKPAPGAAALLAVASVVLVIEVALALAGPPKLLATGSVDASGKIIQDAVVRLTLHEPPG